MNLYPMKFSSHQTPKQDLGHSQAADKLPANPQLSAKSMVVSSEMPGSSCTAQRKSHYVASSNLLRRN